MGIIDKIIINLMCKKCLENEKITLLEKGSTRGSSWQTPPDSEKFLINWKINKLEEPTPSKIKCNTCGTDFIDNFDLIKS
ncbi:hypothetical protein B9Z40_05005 [Limnohabitans sp. 15K]|nr:hypothetical protein B9Z40_05005 [Limnohabitans sp. 15K]